MLKGLSVPTHRVDAPGVYVLPHDTAWDIERIVAEREEMVELALGAARRDAVEAAARKLGRELTEEERRAAEGDVALTQADRTAVEDRHPVERYLAGATRFDPAALDQGPRGQVRIFEYLKPGAEPTKFVLRRVSHETRMRLDPLVEGDRARRWAGWVRAGVERITCGADVLWEATADERVLPDAWLDMLACADGGAAMNLINLAGACAKYSAPLTDAEGKRSA